MNRWRMWNAFDGLPLWFCCGKRVGAEPTGRSFFGKSSKVYLQTPIPKLGLTYGGAVKR